MTESRDKPSDQLTDYEENLRLLALRSYDILDTLMEPEYDDITRIAAQICGTPISLISLVDAERQWFKSHHGLPLRETPREHSVCAHNLVDPQRPFLLRDLRTDDRFAANPLVVGDPKIVFYAGMPLVDSQNHTIGSLCVIDREPRDLDEEQFKSLEALARQTMRLIEDRRNRRLLERQREQLQLAFDNLNEFASIVSHDLRAPLRHIHQYLEVIEEDYANQFPTDALPLFEVVKNAALEADDMIRGVLRYCKSLHTLRESREAVGVNELLADIIKGDAIYAPCQIELPKEEILLKTSPLALRQIFQNMLSNAAKHGPPGQTRINVGYYPEAEGWHYFSITDNGPGIPQKLQKAIFKLFQTVADRDDTTERETRGESHGVGLSIVKKLTEALGGEVWVTSDGKNGSTFHFTIREVG